jgi:hypothetical protein
VVSAGQRDCLVTIEGATFGEATRSGKPKPEWRELPPAVQMRRKTQPRDRSAERMVGDQVSARIYTDWSMPYRADMDPDRVDVQKLRRLVYGGRRYDIISGDHEVRGRSLLLTTIAASRVESEEDQA